MGDASTYEPLPDRTMGDIEVQQLEVEKLGHSEGAGFQRSGTGGITQEPARMRTCRIGAHEGHVKKPIRKPEKPLLCPRCESYDTKFCYFNNYNVNQPRHFCRNCHRYWTAGGLLRNIPKGAGQRRSKHNITHQKHAVSLDAKALGCNAKTEFLHTQKTLFDLDVGQLVSEDGLSASSTMLSFGQQRPVLEVMAVHSVSVQQSNMNKGSFREQCPPCVHANVASNKQILEHESYDMRASTSISCQEAESTPAALEHIHRPSEGLGMVLNYSQEEDGNISSSSSMLNTENDGSVKQEEKGENLGVHDRPPCHFDAAKESHTSTSALYHSSIAWCSFSSTKVSTTATLSNCASTLVSYLDSAKDKAMPMPSDCAKLSEGNFSATTWNWRPQAMWTHPPWLFMPSGPLASNWAGAYWHMPWFLAALPAGSSTRRPGLQSIQADSEDGGCLWVPKTLRIDDPVEAAQSSIWKTLGLDKAPGFSALRKGTEESFQCEAGTQDEEESSTASQHSLPAALSRSITFTETT